MEKIRKAWQSSLTTLKGEHEKINALIDNNKVAYIDLPAHFNVGDLLIYKGTERFFEEHKINVIYRATTKHVSFKALEEADVIVFHGGGNFGDIYPMHQKLREKVIQSFKNKRVICLPQTIQFGDKDSELASASLFKSHPDFHLFTRDLRSYELAKNFTENASLMPDMAHSLHPLVDERELTEDKEKVRILNLVRGDWEATDGLVTANKVTFDWKNIITLSDRFTMKVFNLLGKIPRCDNTALAIFTKLTDDIVFKSIHFFYNHSEVHSDRLHGMILAVLLGKKVVAKDNSYGKNSTYYNHWLKDNPMIDNEYL